MGFFVSFYKCRKLFDLRGFLCFCCLSRKHTGPKMKILNVAEKNDAARNIAELLSNGKYKRRNGRSVYNKIYEFDYNLFNQQCSMVMTSVSGHLLNTEFVGTYRNWQSCNPVSLFEAPISMECPENYKDIKTTLEQEIRQCQRLILWTDCDREGENIGFEILEVCQKVKSNIQVYRAKFSEITRAAVTRAIQNLSEPDKRLNDAVNVRKELDLRIGAAFTRFQTMRLQKVFPNVLAKQLISYGSCQFPTLGFVVERYKQIQSFIPEPFWKIKVIHKKNEDETEFSWKRGRLFDHTACTILYQICLEEPMAKVTNLQSKPKHKWRPQPLDTVELEKTASRKLRINAKEALNTAEKLYTKGFISYPRTETTIFPKELNLTALVEVQTQDNNWGDFARRVFENGPNPRQGSKTDNAHPPIHPIKYVNNLQGNEKTIYEFIVRHFLACLSKDAEGLETTVDIEINDEKFAATGLMIIARNYLEVYPYDIWNSKTVGVYETGETFLPTSITVIESETSSPDLLTEADLIALMERHGIGTDATHAEHIETIKSRLYVGLIDNGRFIPGELGMGLVEGYDMMGFAMSKPHLRAELEADLKRICEGTKNPEVVLREQVAKYKEYFIEAVQQANKIDSALSNYFNTAPNAVQDANTTSNFSSIIMKCPKCKTGDIAIKTRRENKGFYLSCLCYPLCNASIWLPESVEEISLTDNICDKCSSSTAGQVKKLKFKMKRGSLLPYYEDEFVSCIAGCDSLIFDVLNIRPITANASRRSSETIVSNRTSFSDSGFGTNTRNGSAGQSNNGSRNGSAAQNSNSSGNGSAAQNSNFSRNGSAGQSNNFSRNGPAGQSNNFSRNGPAAQNSNFSGNGPGAQNGNYSRNESAGQSNNFSRNGSVAQSNNGSRSGSSIMSYFSSNRSAGQSNNSSGNGSVGQNSNFSGNESAGQKTNFSRNGSAGQSSNFSGNGSVGQRNNFSGNESAAQNSHFTGNGSFSSNFSSGNQNNSRNSNSFPSFDPFFTDDNDVVFTRKPSNSFKSKAQSDGYDNQIACNCGKPAVLLTVRKEGKNTGRKFFKCPEPQDRQCEFFLWEDEYPQQGNNRKRHNSSESKLAAKRKCGLCGALGHNRRNCPTNTS